MGEQIAAMNSGFCWSRWEIHPNIKPFSLFPPRIHGIMQKSLITRTATQKEMGKNPTPETWEEFWVARNYKGTIIKKAMRAVYREAVTETYTNKKAK